MPAAIRSPSELRPPSPYSYEDGTEETRGSFQPEVGVSRMRQRFRTVPRYFDVEWPRMTPDEYSTLWSFYYETIAQGVREFDTLLIDGDEDTLVWFTVNWIGEFDAEFDEITLTWTVRARLRTIKDSFGTRDSGTDQLGAISDVHADNSGVLLVSKALIGASDAGADNSGVMRALPFYGSSDATSSNSGRLGSVGILQGLGDSTADNSAMFIALGSGGDELERVWMRLQWIKHLESADINANAEAVERNWMGY